MDLRFWAATDTGRVRDHNEDNFLVDKNLQLFVVCDGMGGHAAGEVASAICVRTVREVVASEKDLLARMRNHPEDTAAADQLTAVMRRAVKTGNARIFEMAREDPSRRGMGTTCVALVLAGGRGFVGHVGDSRMYRLRDGAVEQITDDHSLLNEMIRQGQVAPGTTEEEFQHQNAVTRAVGVRESVDVDAFMVDVNADDRLLMCSDGLSEYLGDEQQIRGMMSRGEPKTTTQECIELANTSGGKDNITVVVVDCLEAVDTEEPTPRSGEATTEEIPDNTEVMELLRQTPYFHYLAPDQLHQIADVANRVDVAAEDIIVSADNNNEALYLVLEGAVSLTVDDQQVSVLGAGEHFGEMALVDAQDEHDTPLEAEAVEASVLLTIERDQFVGLLRSEPGLAIKLLWNFVQVFADRLQTVPPEFRYLPEDIEAEPEAIGDVGNDELEPEAEVDAESDDDGGEAPSRRRTPERPETPSAPDAPEPDDGIDEAAEPVVASHDKQQLRETVSLDEVERQNAEVEAPMAGEPVATTPASEPEDTIPPVNVGLGDEPTSQSDDSEPSVRFNPPRSGSNSGADSEVDTGLSSGTYDQALLEENTQDAAFEAKQAEPKQAESKQAEPKQAEPKQPEPKQPEPKQSEPKQAEPKQAEPKQAEPKQAEPKQPEPKQPEPKQAEPKQAEPQAVGGLEEETSQPPREFDSGDEELEEISEGRRDAPVDPDIADDGESSDGDDLRSTIQIDWDDTGDDLDIPEIDDSRSSEDVGDKSLLDTGHSDSEPVDEDSSSDRETGNKSSRSLKERLRDRLGDDRPTPAAGVLKKASGKLGDGADPLGDDDGAEDDGTDGGDEISGASEMPPGPPELPGEERVDGDVDEEADEEESSETNVDASGGDDGPATASKSGRKAIAGESIVDDGVEESEPEPEEPKIMISPDLMADVEDEE